MLKIKDSETNRYFWWSDNLSFNFYFKNVQCLEVSAVDMESKFCSLALSQSKFPVEYLKSLIFESF